MAFLDSFFGWNHRLVHIRKRWDRMREKALKKPRPVKALALKKLDAINLNLTTLEEQQLSRADRARLLKIIEIDLAEVSGVLESKPEDIVAEERQALRNLQRGV